MRTQPWGLGPFHPPFTHYSLLHHVASLCEGGTAVEFGVGPGESTRIIAEYLPVVGFGSTEGLPEFWRDDPDGRFDAGAFAFPLPDIPNATLVEGLFSDTLPGFDFSSLDIALCHIDCDLRSSTAEALHHVGDHLRPGAFIVFDEWHNYDSAAEHEQAAFKEWIVDRRISWRVIGHSHQAWAIQITEHR